MILEVDVLNGEQLVYAKSVYQYSKNISLKVSGLELPEKYWAHFSNNKESGLAVASQMTEEGVKIPDELFWSGEYLYIWLSTEYEEKTDETLCTIVVPVIKRPVPIPVSGERVPIITNYDLEPEDENLTFEGILNDLINNSIEEEP